MGKLLEKYTQPDSTVEFTFPLAGDTLKFRRPSLGDIKSLQEYGTTMEGEDNTGMLAKVLKTLCVDLAEESENRLKKDLEVLEAPDRGAILPFYFELLGINRDELMDQVNRNLSQTTKN